MGPEQALHFDAIIHGYRDLAYKYGLWSAASILCDGCSDDGCYAFESENDPVTNGMILHRNEVAL